MDDAHVLGGWSINLWLGLWSVFDGLVAEQNHRLAQFDPNDWVLSN